jgi:hypothetical protein
MLSIHWFLREIPQKCTSSLVLISILTDICITEFVEHIVPSVFQKVHLHSIFSNIRFGAQNHRWHLSSGNAITTQKVIHPLYIILVQESMVRTRIGQCIYLWNLHFKCKHCPKYIALLQLHFHIWTKIHLLYKILQTINFIYKVHVGHKIYCFCCPWAEFNFYSSFTHLKYISSFVHLNGSNK